MRAHRVIVMLLGLLTAVTPSSASAVRIVHPACTDAYVTTTPVIGKAIPAADWKENLAVEADGSLWVSSPSHNKLYHLSPSGGVLTTLAAPGAAGMAFGPDGLLYIGVNKGVFAFAAPGGASVLRINTTATHPTAEPFATGLDTINGLAVGSDGSVYLTSETGPMRRVAPNGQRDVAWSKSAGLSGSNGLVYRNGTLFTTLTLTPNSKIVSLSASNPDQQQVVAQLSGLRGGLLPKGLDDLTVGPDNTLYVAAFATGELLRVDIATGQACALAKGFRLPTSIRPIPRQESQYYLSEAGGRVLKLTVHKNA